MLGGFQPFQNREACGSLALGAALRPGERLQIMSHSKRTPCELDHREGCVVGDLAATFPPP